MCAELNKKDLEEIIEVLNLRPDTDISVYSEAFLFKSIENRMTLTSIKTANDYAGLLSQNTGEVQKLIDSLSITYSTFFRSQVAFSLLDSYILPYLVNKKEKDYNPVIRIWSAGCSAGEEAYSIAILLDELNLSRDRDISFRIFATDISQAMLDLAKKGIYKVEALGNVRQSHICSYFTSEGEAYEVISRLKEHIDFSIYDLLEKHSVCPPPSIYGEFDIIFCSNLLFYYRPDVYESILEKLASCLVDGGYMITGEAERSLVEKTKTLTRAEFPNTIFKKSGAGRYAKQADILNI
jgi:chemotaxis protein methyltransferase CheR